jgi:hypothetical protein
MRSFRATLSQEEIGQLRKSKAKSTAVGETIERPVEIAAKLQLEMPGTHVALKDAALRSEQPREFGYEHGLIGMDLLGGGFTLDLEQCSCNSTEILIGKSAPKPIIHQ